MSVRQVGEKPRWQSQSCPQVPWNDLPPGEKQPPPPTTQLSSLIGPRASDRFPGEFQPLRHPTHQFSPACEPEASNACFCF